MLTKIVYRPSFRVSPNLGLSINEYSDSLHHALIQAFSGRKSIGINHESEFHCRVQICMLFLQHFPILNLFDHCDLENFRLSILY